MTRIVSLTPSRVERDTRTFKEATSFARHRHESIVVEAAASDLVAANLPFRLVREEPSPAVSGEGAKPGASESPPASALPDASGSPGAGAPSARAAYRRLPRPLRAGAERALRVPITLARYLLAERRAAAALPAADLYWLHGYHQFPQTWLAARRHRAPIVYDAHDFYPQVIEGGEATAIERRAVRGFYLAVERACVRAAAQVLTVSDGVADLIAQHSGERPLVVRNCAELRGLRVDGPDVRSAAGLGDDAFVVVMPGNHKAGMRAVSEAIEAVALLPGHAHLVFVGDGYADVGAEVDRRGLGDRVHLLPAIVAVDVPAFIRTADAVAVLYLPTMPAIEYALPNGFFAAIAAGLPVLWPRRLPEIRRLAEEHGLGVAIEPAEPASIAAGVRELLEDPERRAALADNVRRAGDVLNWEVEEARLLEVVKRLTGGRA